MGPKARGTCDVHWVGLIHPWLARTFVIQVVAASFEPCQSHAPREITASCEVFQHVELSLLSGCLERYRYIYIYNKKNIISMCMHALIYLYI